MNFRTIEFFYILGGWAIVGIICALIAGRVCKRRGRSGFCAMLGFLLGPVGIIIAGRMGASGRFSPGMPERMSDEFFLCDPMTQEIRGPLAWNEILQAPGDYLNRRSGDRQWRTIRDDCGI